VGNAEIVAGRGGVWGAAAAFSLVSRHLHCSCYIGSRQKAGAGIEEFNSLKYDLLAKHLHRSYPVNMSRIPPASSACHSGVHRHSPDAARYFASHGNPNPISSMRKHCKILKRADFLSRGFSLVEVVIAIGIVSGSLLTMLSLLSVGQSSLQDGSRQIVQSEIYNTLGSELAETDFSDLNGYCSSSSSNGGRFPAYFDVEGVETSSSNVAVYTAECVLSGSGETRQATVRIGFHQDPLRADTATIKADKRTFLLANRSGTTSTN
jgi:uncharacterized protein (TIGR02598 family)